MAGRHGRTDAHAGCLRRDGGRPNGIYVSTFGTGTIDQSDGTVNDGYRLYLVHTGGSGTGATLSTCVGTVTRRTRLADIANPW